MNKYTDLLLKDQNWILKIIQEENANQVKKWGVQTHTAFQWLTYTTEELGSLAKAISEYELRDKSWDARKKVVSEAIQVATLALKIAEMFDKKA